MKQFALLMGVVIGLGLGAGAARAASTNAITLRFNLTVYSMKPAVTVTNGTTTNTVVGFNKVRFATPDLLRLLETEFNTSFPAGAQLGLDFGNRAVVLDKAGAVILDASSNPADSSYFLSISNNITLSSGKFTETPRATTQMLKLLEPDFGLYYADHAGNQFHFGGLAYLSANAVSTGSSTIYRNVSLLVPGCSGGGTFLNSSDGNYEDAAFAGIFEGFAATLPESSD